MKMNIDALEAATAGGAVAVRSVVRLQPAGGRGDKVFPPTYAVQRGAPLRYALEERRVDGRTIDVALLDSVASQANRMEEALLAAWESGQIALPVIAVDFSDEEALTDLGRITSLQAPHRIADALFRDSITRDGTSFRESEVGMSFTEATPRNAGAVFRYCPTALVFGVWDSTGPKGGLGGKFQRALVSEIVAIDALAGKKTASRIDPAGIQANVDVYHRAGEHSDWTIRVEEAESRGGKPLPFSRTGAEGKGKPSAVNHSNVAPTIDETAGGITFDHALQTTVLSLVSLRRLRFPRDGAGNVLDGPARADAEAAARTALAALGLAAIVHYRSLGYDLRSRSLLVPEEGTDLGFELIKPDGSSERFELTEDEANALVATAAERAASRGLSWEAQPVVLRPAPKLADLIRESRRRAARWEGDETPDGTP